MERLKAVLLPFSLLNLNEHFFSSSSQLPPEGQRGNSPLPPACPPHQSRAASGSARQGGRRSARVGSEAGARARRARRGRGHAQRAGRWARWRLRSDSPRIPPAGAETPGRGSCTRYLPSSSPPPPEPSSFPSPLPPRGAGLVPGTPCRTLRRRARTGN